MMLSILRKIYLNLRSPKRLTANVDAQVRGAFRWVSSLIVLVFLSMPLVFKYRKEKIPFRQLLMFETALKFTRLLDRNKIDYVLITGSLLGAVRQKAFAGRPRDFDVAIKKQDRQKLLDLIPTFKSEGLCVYECTGRRDKANGFILAFPNLLRFQDRWAEIDIHTYLEHGNGWRWDRWDHDIPKITFEINFPSQSGESYAEIFSYKFKIPSNWEDYLVAVYGEEWRTPDAKQFSWQTPATTNN
ncbi:MAG: hypothetical protein WCR08_13325 [Gammaproteobacteria bacterium]